METYSTAEVIKILKEKDITLFSLADFGRLFKIENENTLLSASNFLIIN